MSIKCYYPDWEGGYTIANHQFDKKGDCIICGFSRRLKPLSAVIQICPTCGKVDAYKGDNHNCFQSAQNQYNIDEDYK